MFDIFNDLLTVFDSTLRLSTPIVVSVPCRFVF